MSSSVNGYLSDSGILTVNKRSLSDGAELLAFDGLDQDSSKVGVLDGLD